MNTHTNTQFQIAYLRLNEGIDAIREASASTESFSGDLSLEAIEETKFWLSLADQVVTVRDELHVSSRRFSAEQSKQEEHSQLGLFH